MTLKDEPPRLEGVPYVMGKSRRQPLIVPKRTNSWAKKEMMLSCGCLVIKEKSNAEKNSIA